MLIHWGLLSITEHLSEEMAPNWLKLISVRVLINVSLDYDSGPPNLRERLITRLN